MKTFTAAMLVILAINASFAQAKLGIKLTPSIIGQRIVNDYDSLGFCIGPATVSASMLALLDIPLGRNYFVSTGVGYISKKMSFESDPDPVSGNNTIGLRIQYLQVPATLKLYTDEIALDKKLYFQFGPLLEFKIHDKITSGSFSEDYVLADGNIAMLFVAGIDMLVSPHTTLQFGFNYSRGLINILETKGTTGEIPDVRTDQFGLELTVLF